MKLIFRSNEEEKKPFSRSVFEGSSPSPKKGSTILDSLLKAIKAKSLKTPTKNILLYKKTTTKQIIERQRLSGLRGEIIYLWEKSSVKILIEDN